MTRRRTDIPPRSTAALVGSFMGLPRGSRDLLPPASRGRRRLTQALVDVFEQWGYAQAMTPLLEYYDVLSRGLSEIDRRRCVRFIEPQGGGVVAIRSDFTPQIARIVAQKGVLEAGRSLRVCYAAELVRLTRDDREQAEEHQAGVELIGDGSAGADAEVVALALSALERCGLDTVCVDLSHGSVIRGLLDLCDPEDRSSIEALVLRKDRMGLEARAAEVSEPARSAILTAAKCCDLYGEPEEVWARLPAALSENPGVVRLREVLRHMRAMEPSMYHRLHIDLGEIRGHEYYSGVRIRGWAAGAARPVVRGGRYDHLVGRYGEPAPAIGFAIDIDALEGALARRGGSPVGQPLPSHVVTIAPGGGVEARSIAHRAAASAREKGLRAWVELDLTESEAQQYARRVGADALTVVADDGTKVEYRELNGSHGEEPE